MGAMRKLLPMPRLSGASPLALLAAALLLNPAEPLLARSDPPTGAGEADQARTIADLQRQIDELKAVVETLQKQQVAAAPATALPPPPVTAPAPAPAFAQSAPPVPDPAPAAAQPAAPQLAVAAPERPKAWYEKLRLRGYTQMRFNRIAAGDATAPEGVSRLRSIHDAGINDNSNFSFRRLRMIIQGDLNDHVSLYFQPDFAATVSNQSVGERREGAVSLRDMYADVFPTGDKAFRIRLGQSKVPYGWENMQSSSNRLALDRTDAINSAAAGERDLGVVAYYTPPRVQAIWDRLSADGQKLFGNYGAFGLGAFNGQGLNRTEGNDGVMLVALATWPFELDALGLDGQVFEVGGSLMRNRIRPEIRSGGLSPESFKDERVNVPRDPLSAADRRAGGMELGHRPRIRPRHRPDRGASAPGRLRAGDGEDRQFADRPLLSLRALAVLPRRLQGGDQLPAARDRGAGAGPRVPDRPGAGDHHHLWLGLAQGGGRAPLRSRRGADRPGAGAVELLRRAQGPWPQRPLSM